jgi:hypothetical protein
VDFTESLHLRGDGGVEIAVTLTEFGPLCPEIVNGHDVNRLPPRCRLPGKKVIGKTSPGRSSLPCMTFGPASAAANVA